MDLAAISKITMPGIVIFLMFGIGMTLRIEDFARVARFPKSSLVGLTAQIVGLPLLAFALIYALRPPPVIAVGMIVLAACPGGSMSNLVVYLVRADTALSVTLTAVNSALAPITIPLVVNLGLIAFLDQADPSLRLPFGRTAMQVMVMTLIPIGLGMLLRSRLPAFAEAFDKVFRYLAVILLLGVVGVQMSLDYPVLQEYYGQSGLYAVALFTSAVLFGYAVARVARLGGAQSVSVAVEIGIQNLPLALTVAVVLLGRSEFSVFTQLYAPTMLIGVLLGMATLRHWNIEPGISAAQRPS